MREVQRFESSTAHQKFEARKRLRVFCCQLFIRKIPPIHTTIHTDADNADIVLQMCDMKHRPLGGFP